MNKQTNKQTKKQTNDPIKVGFYVEASDSMAAVEPWEASIDDARLIGVHLAAMYQTGRHRMPSPVWCVWNQKEYASIFHLDDKPRSEAFLNHVLTLMV